MTPRQWRAQNVGDLSGQTWVVTGATRGVGLATAQAAASLGARIVLAVRDVARGVEVGRSLGTEFEVVPLDLVSMDSVTRAADTVSDDVDVLVNNAGTFSYKHTLTDERFELDLAVNFLGPFLFTQRVGSRINRRVVIVGSNGHRRGTFDFDDPHFLRRKWSMVDAYAQSKLADLLWGLELSGRARQQSPFDVQMAHPGWSPSELENVTTWPRVNRALAAAGARLVQTTEQAALSVLMAGTADLPPASYVGPEGFAEYRGLPALGGRSRAASDIGLAQRVWDFAAAELEPWLPPPASTLAKAQAHDNPGG